MFKRTAHANVLRQERPGAFEASVAAVEGAGGRGGQMTSQGEQEQMA